MNSAPKLRIQYPEVGTVWLDGISVVAHPTPPAGLAITPNISLRHQIMDGMGGALTWYASRMLSLSPTKRAEVEGLIFDDLGLDIICLKNWYYPSSYDPGLLRVDSIEHHGNQVSLIMPYQPGHGFILWKSTALAAGSWQKVSNAVLTESDGQLILTDPNRGTTQAFYRVQRDTGV